MRVPLAAASAFSLFVLGACGGGGYGGTPQTPTARAYPSPTAGSGTITIVANRGAQSFAPNPGAGNNRIVVWRNTDSVTHRIVVNDTAIDTGDIPPGGSSRPLQVPAAGANYHCSIHRG